MATVAFWPAITHLGRVVYLCVFLFYVVSTIFQSYNGGQLTCSHCSWAGLCLLSGKPLLSAHTIAKMTTTIVESAEDGK